MIKSVRVLSLAVPLFAAFPSYSEAAPIPIQGLEQFSTEGLGDFTGLFTYSFTNATTAQIILQLTNTTGITNPPTADNAGGKLTAFAFNNPLNLITGVTVSTNELALTPARQAIVDFDTLLGGATFNNTIPVNPFGDADIGVSTTSDWLGGGSPNGGIVAGETLTFTFSLTGTLLNTLTEESFRAEKTSGGSQDVDPITAGQQNPWNVARFRGFDTGGSDKVPGAGPGDPGVTQVPEPTTLLLFGLGLAGLGFWGRRKQS